MQKSCGTAPREAKNIRFCAENMVTFRHRVLLHPTSSGAPSRREPWEHASASTSIIDRCHASTITSTIGGRHTTFPSLPPVRTRQKWDPFLSLTSTRQWSGWKCCSCFIALKGAYDILRTVAQTDGRSPRNPRDTSRKLQRRSMHFARRVPTGRSKN